MSDHDQSMKITLHDWRFRRAVRPSGTHEVPTPFVIDRLSSTGTAFCCHDGRCPCPLNGTKMGGRFLSGSGSRSSRSRFRPAPSSDVDPFGTLDPDSGMTGVSELGYRRPDQAESLPRSLGRGSRWEVNTTSRRERGRRFCRPALSRRTLARS